MESVLLRLGARTSDESPISLLRGHSQRPQSTHHKKGFLPRRRSIQGSGNIPCGCSRNLSPPPARAQVLGHLQEGPGADLRKPPAKGRATQHFQTRFQLAPKGRSLPPLGQPRGRPSGPRAPGTRAATRPRNRAPNSGRTLISPRGTSQSGRGGAVRAADASAGRCRGGHGPALPPGADGARRPPAQAPEGAGPTRGVRDARGARVGVPAPRRPQRLPPAAATPRTPPRRAPPPPRTPHTDPGRPGGAARGPLPGRGEGRAGGRGRPAPECGPPGGGSRGGGARPGRRRGRRDRARSRSEGAGPPRGGGGGGGRPREPEPGRRRAMSSGRRVGAAPGEDRRGAQARARAGGAGRTWGRAAGLETASRGPARLGAQRRPGKGRRGEARTHLGVESGGAGVGVHVPGGGRRRWECRGRSARAGPRGAQGQGAPAPRRARADPSGEGSPGLEVTGVSGCRVAGSLTPGRSLQGELSGGCSSHDRCCGEAGETLRGAAAATASGNPTGSPT